MSDVSAAGDVGGGVSVSDVDGVGVGLACDKNQNNEHEHEHEHERKGELSWTEERELLFWERSTGTGTGKTSTTITPSQVSRATQATHHPSKATIFLALDILHDILLALFGMPVSFARLIRTAPSVEFFCLVARTLHEVIAQRKWKRATARAIVAELRNVLQLTTVSAGVLRALHLIPPRDSHDSHRVRTVLGRNRAQLPKDSTARRHLEQFLMVYRTHTKNRSDISLRSVMSFLANSVVPALELDLTAEGQQWEENKKRALERCRDLSVVQRIARKGTAVARKMRWLQVFITHALGSRDMYEIPREWIRHLTRKGGARGGRDGVGDGDGVGGGRDGAGDGDGCVVDVVDVVDDHDIHRISKPDLEKLHAVAVLDPFNELFFMCLLTTGMRIGGFVRIKCQDVADVLGGKWVVREEGRTLEKDRRMFSFKIHWRVRELMTDWLNRKRAFEPQETVGSEYLLPGRTSPHMNVSSFNGRFKKMCDSVGLHGRQFHLHSLRHCYTHILLEVGNSPEIVSRLVGHADVNTTRRWYLKESAAEVSERAYIPWMQRESLNQEHTPDTPDTPHTQHTQQRLHTQHPQPQQPQHTQHSLQPLQSPIQIQTHDILRSVPVFLLVKKVA